MASDVLVCAQNVSFERLSALHDGELTEVEAERLRSHIATCPACAAQMADLDAVGVALRSSRELEPGDRIVDGVNTRLASPQRVRPLRPARNVWARLAPLAPVAALILLSVWLFTGLPSRNRTTPATTPTALLPTSVATGKPNLPTTTPTVVQLPSFTSTISPATAWGNLTPDATYQTPAGGTTQFSLTTLSPDGRVLFGTETTNIASNSETVYLGAYDFTQSFYRRLGPHWTGFSGPTGEVIGATGIYVTYLINTQPGATCGACHNTLWAYDRMSAATWQIDGGQGAMNWYTSNDRVAFTTPDNKVWVANLATHQVTQIAPGADIHLVGFTWPDLIYEYRPSSQAGVTDTATTLRVLDLQASTTYIMSSPLHTTPGLLPGEANGPGEQTSIDGAMMSGSKTLYLTTNTFVSGLDTHGAAVTALYETLYSISDITNVNGQVSMVARWPLSQNDPVGDGIRGLNNRLIALRGAYVWDLIESKLVRVSPLNASDTPVVSVVGTTLLEAHTISGAETLTPVVKSDEYGTDYMAVR